MPHFLLRSILDIYKSVIAALHMLVVIGDYHCLGFAHAAEFI
jgi:hypothetical protein